jgi:hypothetical protein
MADGCDGQYGGEQTSYMRDRPSGRGHYDSHKYGRGHHRHHSGEHDRGMQYGRNYPREYGQGGHGHGYGHYEYADTEKPYDGRRGSYQSRGSMRGRGEFDTPDTFEPAHPTFEPRIGSRNLGALHGGAEAAPVALDMREMHAIAPLVSTLDVPQSATVGELQHYLGGKLSPAFNLDDTTVRARDAYASHALDASYMVHGAKQFFKNVDSERPLMYEFEFPRGTNEQTFAMPEMRHGGSLLDPSVRNLFEGGERVVGAGAMKPVNVSYDHHDVLQFDGSKQSIEDVARAFGKAMFEKTKYGLYKVEADKPLAFHLSLVDRKTGGMLEDLDHRYKQNGKASIIDVVDHITGGHDGSRANLVALKAVAHR